MPQDWFLQTGTPFTGLPTSALGSCAINPSVIAAASIASCCLTTPAATKTVCVQLPASAATLGSSNLGSTEFVVWRPLYDVSVSRIQIIPQATWTNPSDSSVINVGNSCALVSSYTVCSTALGLGQRVDIGPLTNVAMAACTDLRVNIALGSSGSAPAHAILIDYQTSG